jgi:uncharacterized protein (DUF2237 family)
VPGHRGIAPRSAAPETTRAFSSPVHLGRDRLLLAGLLLTLALPVRAEASPETRSVLGGPLAVCGLDPPTGWRRSGVCETDAADRGTHVVCAEVTEAFLRFTRARGNDLVTPAPAHRFPGLVPGDRWCLCALRWKEALEAGVAPPVVLEATAARALDFVTKASLERHRMSARR